MESSLNEKEGLLLIESMINKARNNFTESGTLYLVWGFAILICSLVQFIGVYFFNNVNFYYAWFLTWIVFIYQMIFLTRKRKTARVTTYTDEIVKYVWISFVACMFLFFFILMYQKEFYLINTCILVLYGVPTFLSGKILKVNTLVFGGIFCWMLAYASVFIPIDFHVLLISIAVIVAWIIPGFSMRKKFINQS